MSRDHKILMYDGTMFDPFHPKEEDISIVNIAHGLSRENRFSGQNPGEPYTVAQHSVAVSQNCCEDHALAGLLHDAAEGLGLRDMATPIKHSFWMWPYRNAENKLQKLIYKRFECGSRIADGEWGWSMDYGIPDCVRKADREAFEVEKAALFPPYTADIRCWSPAEAENRFLARFAELTQHHWTPISLMGGVMRQANRKWAVDHKRNNGAVLDLDTWGKVNYPEIDYGRGKAK
jgi:5'-deoxynucleotidase YfbR-like HD superfamily hydrolase